MPRRRRRKPAQPSTAREYVPGDGLGPTPQRRAMAGEDEIEIVTPDQSHNWRAVRMLDGHVLEYLRNRKAINADHYEAGHRFYSDWYHAGLAASGVIDPGRVIVDGGNHDAMQDRKLTALNAWQKAVQGVGLIHSTILSDILLVEERLESWGRRRRGQNNPKLARHAAITALVLALEALDLFYYPPRRDKVRAAHAPDYKPIILKTAS